MAKKKTVYKIRRKSDGLYSCGGSTPKWTKFGKTWTTLGHVRNHLRLIHEYLGYSVRPKFSQPQIDEIFRKMTEDWMLEEYHVSEEKTSEIAAGALLRLG